MDVSISIIPYWLLLLRWRFSLRFPNPWHFLIAELCNLNHEQSWCGTKIKWKNLEEFHVGLVILLEVYITDSIRRLTIPFFSTDQSVIKTNIYSFPHKKELEAQIAFQPTKSRPTSYHNRQYTSHQPCILPPFPPFPWLWPLYSPHPLFSPSPQRRTVSQSSNRPKTTKTSSIMRHWRVPPCHISQPDVTRPAAVHSRMPKISPSPTPQ